ncbi:unnamed protein product, partial [Closterium sp. Naga37s-1]
MHFQVSFGSTRNVRVCAMSAANPFQVGTCLDDGAGGYNCLCPAGFVADERPDETPVCVPELNRLKACVESMGAQGMCDSMGAQGMCESMVAQGMCESMGAHGMDQPHRGRADAARPTANSSFHSSNPIPFPSFPPIPDFPHFPPFHILRVEGVGAVVCVRGGKSSLLLGATRCVTNLQYTVVTGDTCARTIALYFKSSSQLLAQYNTGY